MRLWENRGGSDEGDPVPYLEVGKPYIPGRASIDPCADYSFRSGQHELLLCFSKLTDSEIAAVRDGEAEFALVVQRTVVFFLYRFGDAIHWSDAPYSFHLVPPDQRQLPALLPSRETSALLSVVLVQADTNTVRALRSVSFPPDFTSALHAAIQAQAVQAWNAAGYAAQLSGAHDRWPMTEQMLSRAIARTKAGL